MASRRPLSTSFRTWKCPQCRSFSTKPHLLAVGPEHPRFIEVPEPPQQTTPYRPFIKGRLPIPRDVFAGAQGKDRASDEEIAKATKRRETEPKQPRGSREEWKQKLSESRRRNLKEGLKGLRARADDEERRMAMRQARKQAEREELVQMPEREDERLTAPSHGLDLEKLLHGRLEDPTREARLAQKARNVELHAAAKKAERADHLHTLYMNARSFIVTPQQLDSAVDEAFDNPDFSIAGSVKPGDFVDRTTSGTSKWNKGKPESVQEMLNKAGGAGGRFAVESSSRGGGDYSTLNSERVRRIAEKLTGGKMDVGA